jgi:hypothetical protein
MVNGQRGQRAGRNSSFPPRSLCALRGSVVNGPLRPRALDFEVIGA